MSLNSVSFASVWIETKQEVLLYCTAARLSSNQSGLQDRSAPILESLLPPCSCLCCGCMGSSAAALMAWPWGGVKVI